MIETMMEALRRKRALTTVRSMAVSESKEQQVHNKAEAVKEQLKNAKGCIDEDASYILQLSHHYYYLKASYYGNTLNTRVVESARRKKIWTRVQACCKMADVTPQRYMKAQFSYFSKQFGRIPHHRDLATPKAIYRAQNFEGETAGRIVGVVEYKVDLREICQQSEDMLQNICKAQKLDRADCYRFLISTGMTSRLHKEFRKMDPVYQEVLKEVENVETRDKSNSTTV